MGQQVVVVDAFTSRAFAGNPAAVCVLESARDEGWMQNVAREMNLSETAFLVPEGAAFRLRWFTPAVEVALCGHATLASAHVLWETGRVASADTAKFHTRSGVLSARRDGEWIEMDFPAEAPQPADPPAGLLDALGIEAVAVARNRFDYLVEVDSAERVRSIRPDHGRLRKVEARGVIVTARADDGVHDFISRFFAPRAGVDEDPVTGSAHCCLAPWWEAKLGRDMLSGFQASSRGGTVHVRRRGDRVLLRGQAVTVMRGELVDGAAP
jgi:PhzF family phenazine biosynthesis protein